tara:strand:- start:167 stop:1390 length:1224 start_codon:yes stop_codon:yes gene_type:complete
MSEIKWATIIPLIGGSAVGCSMTTKNQPVGHLTYSPFASNESHIRRHWPDVPYHVLDEGNTPDLGKLDFVNSVCPCAGLSMLNSSAIEGSINKRGSDAAQNEWMYKSTRVILENYKPKVLWGENAPGLFTKLGEGVVEKLKTIGKEYDYSFSMIKTNTELHGIPQRRMRTFYFFWKGTKPPIFDWYKRDCKSLADYLLEVPKNASCQDMFMVPGSVTEHFKPYQFILEREGKTHKEFVEWWNHGTLYQYLEKYDLVHECIDWLKKYYPTEGFSKKNGTNTFISMLEHVLKKRSMGLGYWDSSPHIFSKSFNALIGRNMFNGVHPTENRYLNVREFLHLMGLPHDFVIEDVKQVNHIAQNVPTCTARDMTEQVVKYINGELPTADGFFVKQDNTNQKIIQESLQTSLF